MARTPSTKNLAAMPDPAALWKRCVGIALVEAAVGSERPHHRIDPSWPSGALFTRDNGAGDGFAIAFVRSGVFLRGFDHQSPMSPYASADGATIWPGMYDVVPKSMRDLVTDASVTPDPLGVTFCLVYSRSMERWSIGVKKWPPRYDETPGDGSRWLLQSIGGDARAFAGWASDYYDRMISVESVERLFEHGMLDEGLFKRLNPKADVARLMELATACRYGKGGCPP